MLNEIVFLAFSTILSVNAQGGGGNITACGNPSQACGQQSYFPANSEPHCYDEGGSYHKQFCGYACKDGFIADSGKCIEIPSKVGNGTVSSCGTPAKDCNVAFSTWGFPGAYPVCGDNSGTGWCTFKCQTGWSLDTGNYICVRDAPVPETRSVTSCGTPAQDCNVAFSTWGFPGAYPVCGDYDGTPYCTFKCQTGWSLDTGNYICVKDAPDQGKNLVTSCGIPAQDCTSTPLALPGASPACKADSQGKQSCSFTCNAEWVFDAGNNDCVQGAEYKGENTASSCGVGPSQDCTKSDFVGIPNSTPSCFAAPKGTQDCSFNCNVGFKHNTVAGEYCIAA